MNRVILTLAWTTLALLGMSHATGQVAFVGSRIIEDADFYAHGDRRLLGELAGHARGGRILLVVENVGSEPLSIEGFAIDGIPFEDMSDTSLLRGSVPSANWWSAMPQAVAPGGFATLRARLTDVSEIAGRSTAFTLETSGGSTAFDVAFERSPLWMPFVGFGQTEVEIGSVSSTTIYVSNAGDTPISIPTQGNVWIDGHLLDGRLPEGLNAVRPGRTVAISVELPAPIAIGEWVAIRVLAESGVEAVGSLRAFPDAFGTSFWQLGYRPDLADPSLEALHISTDIVGTTAFQDEPLGGRIAPMDLAGRIERSWREDPERPVMLQLTGYVDNLVYADLGDVTMSHHRELEQDLGLFLSWPKPVWYLPQNAWGRVERVGDPESWPPLEDLWVQALQGVAHGAKHIQWFTFYNLWQQGFGRGGATDTTRNHTDISMPGAVGNPLLLDRVGRISGTLSVLAPYLETSAVHGRVLTPYALGTSILLSGTDRAVVILLDEAVPWDAYSDAQNAWWPSTLNDRRVQLEVPSFASIDMAISVDLFDGVRAIPHRRISDTVVELDLEEVRAAQAIVLGRESDFTYLQQAWNALPAAVSDGSALREELLRWSVPSPVDDVWEHRGLPFRFTVDVIGSESTERRPAAPVFVRIPWPPGLPADLGSVRVADESGARSIPIDHDIGGRLSIADFAGNDPEASAEPMLTAGTGFTERFSVQVADGMLTTTYLTSATDRYYFFHEFPQLGPSGGQAQLPATHAELIVEAKDLVTTDGADLQRVILHFDRTGDGVPDGSRAIFLAHQPSKATADGWTEYTVDVLSAFRRTFPEAEDDGWSWGFSFQTEVLPTSAPRTSTWSVRSISASARRTLVLHPRRVPSTDGMNPSDVRSYTVYFDVVPRGAGPRSEPVSPPSLGLLDEAVPPSWVSVQAVGPVEIAGLRPTIEGRRLTLEPQATYASALVRWFDASGTLTFQETMSSERRRFVADIDAELGPGDVLVVTAVHDDGRGDVFGYAYDGHTFSHIHPRDASEPGEPSETHPDWMSVHGTDGIPTATTGALDVVDFDVVDVANRASWVALAETWTARDGGERHGRVRLLEPNGVAAWSLNEVDGVALGPVFSARFSRDGSKLFVAAQVGPQTGQDYENVMILGFDIAGSDGSAPKEIWRRRSGDPLPEPGRAVHRMDVYADGGLVYADWHGNVIRLDDRDGSVEWSHPAGGYVVDLHANEDGGATIGTALYATLLDRDGAPSVSVRRGDGAELRAVASSRDGALLAIAEDVLRVVRTSDGTDVAKSNAGRHPRFVEFLRTDTDDVRIATGSMDGVFQIVDRSGRVLWKQVTPDSIVVDVLQIGTSDRIAVTRELFAYDVHEGWRFRTEVDVFDMSGTRIDGAYGPWRAQPTMAFAVAAGTALSVLAELDLLVVPRSTRIEADAQLVDDLQASEQGTGITRPVAGLLAALGLAAFLAIVVASMVSSGSSTPPE